MSTAKKEYLIKRPGRIDLQKIAAKAEHAGMYVVESERRGMMYCYNDGEYAILTAGNGMVMLTPLQVETVLTELAGIKDDIDELIRKERRS